MEGQENSSNVNILAYKDSLLKKRQNNKSMNVTPLKIREGWDNGHGLLDLNK